MNYNKIILFLLIALQCAHASQVQKSDIFCLIPTNGSPRDALFLKQTNSQNILCGQATQIRFIAEHMCPFTTEVQNPEYTLFFMSNKNFEQLSDIQVSKELQSENGLVKQPNGSNDLALNIFLKNNNPNFKPPVGEQNDGKLAMLSIKKTEKTLTHNELKSLINTYERNARLKAIFFPIFACSIIGILFYYMKYIRTSQ